MATDLPMPESASADESGLAFELARRLVMARFPIPTRAHLAFYASLPRLRLRRHLLLRSFRFAHDFLRTPWRELRICAAVPDFKGKFAATPFTKAAFSPLPTS